MKIRELRFVVGVCLWKHSECLLHQICLKHTVTWYESRAAKKGKEIKLNVFHLLCHQRKTLCPSFSALWKAEIMISYLVCIFLPLWWNVDSWGAERLCGARALLKVSSVLFGILSNTETKITKTTHYVRLSGWMVNIRWIISFPCRCFPLL